MKNLKFTILFLLLWQLSQTSCKKLEYEKKDQASTKTASTFTEIKSVSSFKWSTTKKITIEYTPNTSDTRVSVLKIVDSNGNLYLKKLQKASDKFSTTIELPIHVNKLRYSFAGVQKEFTTSSDKLKIELN